MLQLPDWLSGRCGYARGQAWLICFPGIGDLSLRKPKLSNQKWSLLQNGVFLVLTVIARFPWQDTGLSDPLYGFLFLTAANLREHHTHPVDRVNSD